MILGGIFFAGLGGVLIGTTVLGSRDAERLRTAGVAAMARIEELKLAPNGVTPRLIYRLPLPAGGSITHNAEVERMLWNHARVGQEVPVVYVPQKPELTQLAFGEVVSRTSPLVSYGMAGFVGLLGLCCLAGGLLMRGDREIRFTPETMRISIKRYGAPD